LWAWRLTFVDGASGRLIWESILPLSAQGKRGGNTSTGARARLDYHDPGLTALLQQEQATKLAALAEEMRAPVALLTDRERAIAKVLEERHARLAAGLVQTGLFDRRAERAAAAQASVLSEARSQTAARLIELAASGRPMLEECRLVFAVALQ
jgi:hypothetical protein